MKFLSSYTLLEIQTKCAWRKKETFCARKFNERSQHYKMLYKWMWIVYKKGFYISFATADAFILVVKMKSWWTKRNFSSPQFSVQNAKNGSLCLFILVSDEFTKISFSFFLFFFFFTLTLSWYLCSYCCYHCSKYVWNKFPSIYATMLSCYVCGVETVNIITYTHCVVTY